MKTILSFLCSLFLIACNTGTDLQIARNIETPQLAEWGSDYVRKHTTHFTIENQMIQGTGFPVWKNMINQSQFIMFGERHSSEATSKLINAILPLMDSVGFNHFALEVGPYSAKKLEKLSTPPMHTETQLREFMSTYSQEEEHQIPIPFFQSKVDAQFLQTAREQDMQLWGLDQEYFASTQYLMDDLLQMVQEDPDFPQIQREHELAEEVVAQWYDKEESADDDFDVFGAIQKEEAVQQYLARFRERSNTRQIIIDMEISWDIYSRWRKDSHADRISYMRSNFMKNYNRALKEEATPKVFAKFGGLHASKILTGGCYDLGDLMYQLSIKNGTEASIINTWHRYYIDDEGVEIDYMDKYKNYYSRFKDLMSFAKKDAYTIINLKQIRQDIESGHVALPTNGDYHKLKALIEGYDYQLILPLDKASLRFNTIQ